MEASIFTLSPRQLYRWARPHSADIAPAGNKSPLVSANPHVALLPQPVQLLQAR